MKPAPSAWPSTWRLRALLERLLGTRATKPLPATKPARQNGLGVSASWCKRLNALSIALCTATAASMTMGCASSVTVSQNAEVPANLRQPCQQLPDPADGTGAALLRWAIEVVGLYNDCADRHDKTVEAIK